MSESALRTALHVLAEQSVQQVAKHDLGLQYFGGAIAFYDMRRDQIITELPGFENVRTALGSLPIVQELYGDGGPPDRVYAWERLDLQFVYGFLGRLTEPTFDPEVFESTWQAFWEELSEPEWTWLGLANLQNF